MLSDLPAEGGNCLASVTIYYYYLINNLFLRRAR
jgi:hypothetical protein